MGRESDFVDSNDDYIFQSKNGQGNTDFVKQKSMIIHHLKVT